GGDFAGKVTTGDGGRHFSDVTHLTSQVTGHGIDVIGQVFPGSGHAWYDGLTTEFAFGADFAGHASHFSGEGTQLVHHRVNTFFELQNFTADVHRNLLGQVAIGHGNRHFGDVTHLTG